VSLIKVANSRGYHQDHPRHLVSRLVQPVSEIPHGTNSAQPRKFEDISAKSHRMLVDYGLIRPCHPGSFAFLTLALRSIEKLNAMIDLKMSQIGAQKILLPTLTDGNLWQKSGRWKLIQDELLRLKNRHGQDYVLGPTFEEAISHLVAGMVPISFKALPLKLYQTSTKFRDEMKPKFGLIRSKEFIMKDLYTFDADLAQARTTYALVQDAYDQLFKELSVPFVRVKGDNGAIGGQLSHEYHFPCDIGQDNLIICDDCSYGNNSELSNDDATECSNCNGKNLSKSKGIEVGHTFLLGDKYSKIFKANYVQSNGKPATLQMGCFGLGVSRIMAASLEVLSTEHELKWPESIAPFKMAILAPKGGSKEASAVDNVFKLYDQMNNTARFNNDVIIDDRDKLTVGKKLREAKRIGYPYIVLYGKESIDSQNPVIELHNRDEVIKLPISQVLYHFESLYQHQ
jgi:prolyl-tRNA synthetase